MEVTCRNVACLVSANAAAPSVQADGGCVFLDCDVTSCTDGTVYAGWLTLDHCKQKATLAWKLLIMNKHKQSECRGKDESVVHELDLNCTWIHVVLLQRKCFTSHQTATERSRQKTRSHSNASVYSSARSSARSSVRSDLSERPRYLTRQVKSCVHHSDSKPEHLETFRANVKTPPSVAGRHQTGEKRGIKASMLSRVGACRSETSTDSLWKTMKSSSCWLGTL